MRNLYHAAPIPLAPGSVILPGNWGRIIRSFGERHDRWASEQVFEQVRQAGYAYLPSRLNACFACTSELGIRFFARIGFRGNSCPPLIYEVEKAESDAPEHCADYNLIQVNKPNETLEGNAERYWRGDFWYEIGDGPAPGYRAEEIVTVSPLRILRCLPADRV